MSNNEEILEEYIKIPITYTTSAIFLRAQYCVRKIPALEEYISVPKALLLTSANISRTNSSSLLERILSFPLKKSLRYVKT